MAFFRWIAGFVMAVLVSAFAVMNREDVSFVWSPVHDPVQVPMYLVVLGALVAGFLFGGFVVWVSGSKVRREKRLQKKEIKNLEKHIVKLENIRKDPATPPAGEIFSVLPSTDSNSNVRKALRG